MVSLNINSAIREVQTISKLFNNEALDGVLPSIPNINKIGATIFIPLVGLILLCPNCGCSVAGKQPTKQQNEHAKNQIIGAICIIAAIAIVFAIIIAAIAQY